ncbi:hypothetical protein [Sphingobium sp. MK2]|uniref:hypothetical protein n=1 Tax=Sphingobium sp. MK2 TaxID=3116540 RepID=UPI0032E35C35
MSSLVQEYYPITERSQVGIEAARGKLLPLGHAYFKASVSAIGIVVACASEMFSMKVALSAQYGTLSDGTNLGEEMMSMRWGIVAALILSHALIHDNSEADGHPVRKALRKFGVLPIVALMGGMAAFMFVATAQTAGEGDGIGGIAGAGLGLACGALFSVSFLASNRLMGKLLPAIRTILSGRAERAEVESISHELAAADACYARIAVLQSSIAEREAPDVLRRKAAVEAADLIGQAAAQAHDAHASVESVGSDIRPEDVVMDLPDTPLPALDRLQAYLKSLNVQFFLTLLKNKEV